MIDPVSAFVASSHGQAVFDSLWCKSLGFLIGDSSWIEECRD